MSATGCGGENVSINVGEWHFHPHGAPDPSGRDMSQMRDIATERNYRCPEPLLLIVGGEPDRPLDFGAFVCLGAGRPVELSLQTEPTLR